MASLTLENIGKRFGKFSALRGVDLRVRDGEFCVLVGPSGCGKSTLLNIVAGLVPQDEGRVLFDEKPVDRLAPRERDVAMVFQSYALYPHLTVAGNLGFGLRMRGVPKAETRVRVREVARLLGIETLLDRKPRALSGGQRQRVAMGRAIVRRPNLFLLDEPLSNLDARLRAGVRVELKRLHQRLRGTAIYVTHDQVEAMTLGDRVAVMGEGRIHQFGPPGEIYSRPMSPFVARFMGTPEINLYTGRIEALGGRRRFRGRGLEIDLGAIDVPEGEVELGIRPEDLRPGGEKPGLEATVELVSHLGSEKIVHARLGQEAVTFRAAKDSRLSPGAPVRLEAPAEKVHLFRGGKRI